MGRLQACERHPAAVHLHGTRECGAPEQFCSLPHLLLVDLLLYPTSEG